MKTYTVRRNENGTFAVIDETGKLESDGYLYVERAQQRCDSLNPRAPHIETPEEEHALALRGVPSTKSLKNLDAKLAAIKRAEEIENGDETL